MHENVGGLTTPLKIAVTTVVLLAVAAAWGWAISRVVARRPLLPREPLRMVPWGEGSVLLVVITFILLRTTIGELTLRLEPFFPRLSPAGRSILAVSLFNAAMIVVIPCLLRLTSRASLEDLGLSLRELGKNILRGALAVPLVIPVIYIVFNLALLVFPKNTHQLETMIRTNPDRATVGLAFLSAVVLGPMAEELLFRGVLQGWLTRLFAQARLNDQVENDSRIDLASDTFPNPKAPLAPSPMPILITSVAFGGIHLEQMPAPIPLFFFSVALGFLVQRTGSIVPAIILHALFNACSTVSLLLS
jgi:membrane protease YdiL (CAAX protease family)